MVDDAVRELAEAVARHLDDQHQRSNGGYVYGDEGRGGPDWDGEISIDGEIDLYKLVAIFRFGIPRLATELPELSASGESEPVLLQWGSRPDIHIARYSSTAARERPETGGWISEVDGNWCENPQCWWEMPRTLAPAALADLEGAPLPVDQGVDDPVVGVECPKCGQQTGDDWSQCQGACPIPGSPHYSAREALRRILRPVRR